jgi:hypothetical protein
MIMAKDKLKISRVLSLAAGYLLEFYLYFALVYVITLVVNYFLDWNTYINWRVFHGSIVVLGILSLISLPLHSGNNQNNYNLVLTSKRAALLRWLRGHYISVGVTLIVLAIAIGQGVSPLSFWLLTFALLVVLFVKSSMWPSIGALVFLLATAGFLLVGNRTSAAVGAAYVYYFLMISFGAEITRYFHKD